MGPLQRGWGQVRRAHRGTARTYLLRTQCPHVPLGPSSSAHGISSIERNLRSCPAEVISENAHGSRIHNRPKLDTVQRSVHGRRALWELHPHCGTLFSNDEVWRVDPGNHVGDCPGLYYTERSLTWRNLHCVIPSVGRSEPGKTNQGDQAGVEVVPGLGHEKVCWRLQMF